MTNTKEQRVEISVEPYKRIVIRSYMQFASPEYLVSSIAAHIPKAVIGRIGSLLWSNEIVFKQVSLPNSEVVSKELLLGNLWIGHIDFAHMPRFQPDIMIPDGDVTFSVIDTTGHTTFDGLTSWIRSHLLKKS